MKGVLPIELLRTFHAVVRIGKFSSAALYLHKSPAAISVHIQRLEAIAGGRLMQRDNQSVMLTALGKKLLRSSAELLHTHDKIMADLHGPDLKGRIILGVPDEYAEQIIKEILPTFTASWPNVVMELKMGPSDELKKWVEREKLNVAIIVQPKGEICQNAQLIMSTTPVWVGPLNKDIALEDPLPLAVYTEPCVYRKAITESLKASGRRSRIILESHSSQAVKACVESGLAAGLIDRGKVTGRMQILEGMPEVPDHNILFIHSAASAVDDVVTLLAREMQQLFHL